MLTVSAARSRTSTTLVVLAALLLSPLVAVLAARAPAGAEPGVPGAVEPERRYAPGIDPTLAADATLRGTVLGPDGKLRDNVLVEAFSALDPTGEPVASDLTYEVGDVASHGAYTLHLPAGDYLVRFSSLDDARRIFEPVYYGGGAGSTVTLAADQALTLDPVTLRRDQGAPVTGRIVDSAHQPMVGIEVLLFRVYPNGDVAVLDEAWTDDAGRYRFARAPRGRALTVMAYGGEDVDGMPLGLPNTWLGGQPSWYTADRFTVGSRSTGEDLGDLVHRAGAAVTGRVTTATGPASADVALIHLDGHGNGTVVAWEWVEGSNDSFAFSALPGQYTIGIQLAGGEWWTGDWIFLGDTPDLDEADRFTVADAALDAGTLVVGGRTSAVTFRVLDRDGEPAEWLLDDPSLYDRDGTYLWSAADQGDGFYEARVPWGTDFTIGVYDLAEDAEEWVYLGGTTTFEDATFLRASSATPTIDAGTLSLALAAPTAPAPVLGGRARSGQLLSVGTPTWSVAGVTSTYQWMRDGSPILGQTAASYLLEAADVGHRVSVRVTGRAARRAPGTTTSAALLVGPGEAPAAIRAPSVTGRAVLGGTLIATPPVWDIDGVTTTFAWYADGRPIPGATASALSLTWEHVGARITVVATGTRAGSATATSIGRAVTVERVDPGLRAVLRKGDLRVELHAPAPLPETGKLALYDGKKLIARVGLVRRDRGLWTFDLADLPRGKHRRSVSYSGNEVLMTDRTRPVTVRTR